MSKRGWFTSNGLILGTLTYFAGAMFIFAVMVAEPHASASPLRIASGTIFAVGLFIAVCGLFARDRAEEMEDEQSRASRPDRHRSASPAPRSYRGWDDDSGWVE